MKRSTQVILCLVVAAAAIGIINHSLFGMHWWCMCAGDYPDVVEECEDTCEFWGSTCLYVDLDFINCVCMSGDCACPYNFFCENFMGGRIITWKYCPDDCLDE